MNSKLRIVCGTWNVNEKMPSMSASSNMESDARQWLHLHNYPDIVVLGLQEIEMTANAMLKEQTIQKYVWELFFQKYGFFFKP